jgi:spore germination protein KB
MKQEIDKISYREYLFLVFNHIIGYTLVLSFTDSVAKQDSWLVILSGFLTAIPFVLLYAVLAKRFPSKTLLEVYRLVFGKWIGTAVSFLYVLLFLVVLGFYLRDLEEFYTGFIQPETPPVLFVVVALTAAAYGIMTGIEFLAKMSFPFAVLSILSIVVTFVFLIGKMDFSNFLPVLRQPPKTYLSSISQFALVPCGQMMFLLMLTPKLRSARRLPRYSLLGLALGVSGFLLISIRNTAVLGPMASLVNSASYDATSLIDIGDIFTGWILSWPSIRRSPYFSTSVSSIMRLPRERRSFSSSNPCGGRSSGGRRFGRSRAQAVQFLHGASRILRKIQRAPVFALSFSDPFRRIADGNAAQAPGTGARRLTHPEISRAPAPRPFRQRPRRRLRRRPFRFSSLRRGGRSTSARREQIPLRSV